MQCHQCNWNTYSSVTQEQHAQANPSHVIYQVGGGVNGKREFKGWVEVEEYNPRNDSYDRVGEPLDLVVKTRAQGSKCNGCGLCCHLQLCPVAKIIGHKQTPCPELVLRDGRYWCRIVEFEAQSSLPKAIAAVLGIGTHCVMTDDISYWYPDTQKL